MHKMFIPMSAVMVCEYIYGLRALAVIEGLSLHFSKTGLPGGFIGVAVCLIRGLCY